MSSHKKVMEYRYFPAAAKCGLLGGICAGSAKEAEAFNTEDKGKRLVRVRLEYSLPAALPELPGQDSLVGPESEAGLLKVFRQLSEERQLGVITDLAFEVMRARDAAAAQPVEALASIRLVVDNTQRQV